MTISDPENPSGESSPRVRQLKIGEGAGQVRVGGHLGSGEVKTVFEAKINGQSGSYVYKLAKSGTLNKLQLQREADIITHLQSQYPEAEWLAKVVGTIEQGGHMAIIQEAVVGGERVDQFEASFVDPNLKNPINNLIAGKRLTWGLSYLDVIDKVHKAGIVIGDVGGKPEDVLLCSVKLPDGTVKPTVMLFDFANGRMVDVKGNGSQLEDASDAFLMVMKQVFNSDPNGPAIKIAQRLSWSFSSPAYKLSSSTVETWFDFVQSKITDSKSTLLVLCSQVRDRLKSGAPAFRDGTDLASQLKPILEAAAQNEEPRANYELALLAKEVIPLEKESQAQLGRLALMEPLKYKQELQQMARRKFFSQPSEKVDRAVEYATRAQLSELYGDQRANRIFNNPEEFDKFQKWLDHYLDSTIPTTSEMFPNGGTHLTGGAANLANMYNANFGVGGVKVDSDLGEEAFGACKSYAQKLLFLQQLRHFKAYVSPDNPVNKRIDELLEQYKEDATKTAIEINRLKDAVFLQLRQQAQGI